MAHEEVSITTSDGVCPTHVLTPAGAGPWPAVILYMDGLAIRPAIVEMAAKMAEGGYVVLLPDMFYRSGRYEPFDPREVFANANFRETIGPMMAATGPKKAAEDTAAFLAYIDTRKDVLGTKVGTTGYCMGGGMSLTAAGTYPERIAAAAAFHAGNIATDAETSPHLVAPEIKGRIYVAGADKDDSYPPAMAARMEKALTDAGVDHKCEIYEGALHGWTMTDFPVYNEAAADRHWHELFKLFAETLH